MREEGGRRKPQKQGSAIGLDIGPTLEPNQARNYKTIEQILYWINRMCVQAGFGGKHEETRAEAAEEYGGAQGNNNILSINT